MDSTSLSSGDALGGFADKKQTDRELQMGARVAALMQTHGTPGKVVPGRFAALMATINAKFGAKNDEQKEAVKDTLTYLAIVHGSGPNVRWQDIEAAPEGCKPLKMNEVVDKVITREFHRRFMTHFSERATQMFDASPDLQNVLIERAVRNGIPTTAAKAVIDFLDSSTGVDPGTIAYRTQSKYSAVARANKKGVTSVEQSASAAGRAMHGYNDDDAASVTSL